MRAPAVITLCLAALLLCSGAQARSRKKPAQENVTRVRITLDMAELRDSVEAVAARDFDTLMIAVAADCIRWREELALRIDAITGLGRGRAHSSRGDLLVSLAKEHLGKPYKWAANGPFAFDCSGFTRYIYKEIGITIPRHSGDQYRAGRRIEVITDLQEGDLVFFGKKNSIRTIGHVGMVVSVDRERGRFSFIHASSSGGVRISPNTDPYFFMRYIGAARFAD